MAGGLQSIEKQVIKNCAGFGSTDIAGQALQDTALELDAHVIHYTAQYQTVGLTARCVWTV